MRAQQPAGSDDAGADGGRDPPTGGLAAVDVVRPVVLVVEDSPEDWEIYGRILCYNGYDVLYAATGDEGYRLACAHRPDLILLDLVLPNLDGLTLCRQLKRQASTAHIPIIVLSGKRYAEAGHAAELAGCALYLEKPTGPVQVLHRVESLIGRAPLAGEGQPPVILT